MDRKLLFQQVLPWMALGIPLGALAAASLPTTGMRAALGATVALLVVRDLWGLPVPTRVSRLGLLGAGVSEGLLGTGGPLLVWSLGRLTLEPRAVRTTLLAVWWVTEVVVIALWSAQGRLNAATLGSSAVLWPSAFVGLWFGERALRRLDPVGFRRAVTAGLAIAALALFFT